ncbi:hypothetical protein AVEN_106020-1 [Araneus ventricosus]|uniref:Uncharacterized protein n=1 Tax=Araneus ventricosus TaxID=182803 RepID=A0A4Y2X062_ARAVE|nr:hypothetical protein AVEN_106020-1 [Araneus ventricosus]
MDTFKLRVSLFYPNSVPGQAHQSNSSHSSAGKREKDTFRPTFSGGVIVQLNIPCREHLFPLNARRKACTSTIQEIKRRPENMCEKGMKEKGRELFITDLLFA